MLLLTRSTSFLAVLCCEKIRLMNNLNTGMWAFNCYISVLAVIKVSAQKTCVHHTHNALRAAQRIVHACYGTFKRLHDRPMSKTATSAMYNLVHKWVQVEVDRLSRPHGIVLSMTKDCDDFCINYFCNTVSFNYQDSPLLSRGSCFKNDL